MEKLTITLVAYMLLALGPAHAANGQAIAKAKSACQANPTQCSQVKASAKKEVQAAKDACAKNPSACDNAKSKAKSAMQK